MAFNSTGAELTAAGSSKFNLTFSLDMEPMSEPTLIFSFDVSRDPITAKTYSIRRILMTGPSHTYLELRINDVVVYAGQTTLFSVDHNIDLQGVEVEAIPGSRISILVQHWKGINQFYNGFILGERLSV